MKHRLAGVVTVVVLALVGTASAGTFGEPKVGHRYTNGATSLKVTEPENFKITITTEEGERAGTVPEVFAMPEKDQFVKVTLTAPDGTVWTKKVEVVAKKQTELAISFKGDAPKAEAAATRRNYIGRMQNSAGGCGLSWRLPIRADFLDPATGTVLVSKQVEHNKNQQLEVPAGTAEIRVFLLQNKEWKFVVTGKHTFAKDGWQLGFGCKEGTTTPIVTGL
jgi:hypothetical protein